MRAPLLYSLPVLLLLVAAAPRAAADGRVAIVAEARPDYTAHKFADGKPRRESYVFMEGHYFEGVTVDHSIERTPFRRIAEFLAPELARQQYLPAAEIAKADLVLVVHWGTTIPRLGVQEMSGQTSLTTDLRGENSIRADANAHPDGDAGGLPDAPDNNRGPEPNDLDVIASRVVGDVGIGNGVSLLGYNSEIHRLNKRSWMGAEGDTLNFDLIHERYFIILMAYDLQTMKQAGVSRKPLWTMHLNISSPGNNFQTALDRMSTAAVNYFGRTTLGVTTVRPGERQGTVNIAPIVILGETK